VETPDEMDNVDHVYHMYAIKIPKRDSLQEFLRKNGVATGIHYPIPLHFQKAHKDLGYRRGDFPKTEANAKSILSLPIFPGITDSEVKTIASYVKEFIENESS